MYYRLSFFCVLQIQDLPDLAINKILRQLSTRDLTLCVPELGERWIELSHAQSLWTHRVFEATDGMSDIRIITILQRAPPLRHFVLNHADDIDAILEQLITHCDHIRTIRIKWKKGLKWDWISKLFVKYNNIECLECYVPLKYVTLDYVRYLGHFQDRKYLIMNDELGEIRRLQTYDSFYQRMTVAFDRHHADGVLRHSTGLRHLAVEGDFVSSTAVHLYNYNNLKSLCVQDHGSLLCIFDITRLSCISTLENLHLYSNSNIVVRYNPEGDVEFPRLVKLEIICTMQPAQISGLLSACNRLEFLRLSLSEARDDDLVGLEECSNLKHLDLSFNYPGFRNDTLRRISEGCHELQFLDLSWSKRRIRYNLRYLSNCTRLRHLRLNNQVIFNSDLRHIQNRFWDLRELNITKCSPVSAYGVQRLHYWMPGLRIVRNEEVTETLEW